MSPIFDSSHPCQEAPLPDGPPETRIYGDVPTHCCVGRSQGEVDRQARTRISDHEGQFGERAGKPGGRRHVGPEIVEAPAEVLDEGVPRDDDPGGAVAL